MEIDLLDSFVLKFKQNWKSGYSAHLDIDTCAGQAWVGLCVHLGHVHGDHGVQEVPKRKSDSPSRQRLCARRVAKREAVEVSNLQSKGLSLLSPSMLKKQSILKL